MNSTDILPCALYQMGNHCEMSNNMTLIIGLGVGSVLVGLGLLFYGYYLQNIPKSKMRKLLAVDINKLSEHTDSMLKRHYPRPIDSNRRLGGTISFGNYTYDSPLNQEMQQDLIKALRNHDKVKDIMASYGIILEMKTIMQIRKVESKIHDTLREAVQLETLEKDNMVPLKLEIQKLCKLTRKRSYPWTPKSH